MKRVAILLLSALVASNATAQVIETSSGNVRGVLEDRVLSFKGIPYAQAPVGKYRWQPPQPVKKSRKEIDATSFGDACVQPHIPNRPQLTTSEDCLNLNVWTPGLDNRARPVMVWIHGGAFRSGSNQVPGEALAEQDAVVVSINYRLGPLGFFNHTALKNDAANYGLMDMTLALKWVRENIYKFGGNPHNVTIFGVSAGGMAVNLLMVHKPAHGFFQRAIAQSGYATWALPRTVKAPSPAPKSMAMQSADSAEQLAESLVASITDKRQSRRVLTKLDAQALVVAVKGYHLPIVDGTSLLEEPGILFARGEQADVPFMTGGNSFEGSVMPGLGLTPDWYKSLLGDRYEDVRRLYADDFAVSEEQGLTRAFGDHRYLIASRYLGGAMQNKASNAYLYYIKLAASQRQPDWPGSPHGYDAYLMWAGHKDENPEVRNLAVRMQQYWLGFARKGRPHVEGLPAWFTYNPESDHWMVFGERDQLQSGVIKAKLDLLTEQYQERVTLH